MTPPIAMQRYCIYSFNDISRLNDPPYWEYYFNYYEHNLLLSSIGSSRMGINVIVFAWVWFEYHFKSVLKIEHNVNRSLGCVSLHCRRY